MEDLTRTALTAPVFSADDIDIPYTEYTLPNGLVLIVHEDHKAPVVAVNVWYHVGSKNEREGKSGFAHLFEHLMFNGSEHFNDDYFQALLAIGATDLNGTTNHDRTNYFQNVPTAALDQVLWLESDRMGHLLGGLDQGKLDEQRGVVLNEKKQHENVPYGREHEILLREMYPDTHPYAHTVIGFAEDIEKATLEDCREWFKAYYGAANAVLVVAGDVDPEDVLQRVNKYFGDIPAGSAIVRPMLNIPRRLHNSRVAYQDRVPEARIVIAWNSPQLGSREDALMMLAAAILSRGKNSRLYQALVYDRKIASSVSASQWGKEIAGLFVIEANAKPGKPVSDLEDMINEIMEEFIEHGPVDDELSRVRAQYFAGFMKGLERIGGLGGKSDLLASSKVYGGTPDAYKRYNKYIEEATIRDVHEACRSWLRNGRFTLICNPLPVYKVNETGADRSALPVLGPIKPGVFPDVQRRRLANGLEIILAYRKGTPTVVVEAMMEGGYSYDGSQSGLASLTMSMLDEGTRSMNALEINEQLQLLGASLSCSASLDHCYVRLNTLKQNLAQSFHLFGEILVHPIFPDEELDRLKMEFYAAIQREKVSPMPMAMRVMPKLLFGAGHRYAQPLTGSGYETSVNAIGREDVLTFYSNWIRPNNTKLIIVGDVTLDEAEELVQLSLRDWESQDLPSARSAGIVEGLQNILYLLDRAEAQQSIVIGAYLAHQYNEETSIAEEFANDVLGGQFISRINVNLREDKHWTYGARTVVLDTQGQRPIMAYSSVQKDKTADSILEIRKEFEKFNTSHPVSNDEFVKNQRNAVLALPGQWETNAAVANSLATIVKWNLPDNYYQLYPQKLQQVSLADVHTASQTMINVDALNWFVVGDPEIIIPSLKEIGFDKIVRVDAEGNEIELL